MMDFESGTGREGLSSAAALRPLTVGDRLRRERRDAAHSRTKAEPVAPFNGLGCREVNAQRDSRRDSQSAA
jgi:hypothetical protein